MLNSSEHKNRVLYTTNDATQSQKNNPIKQVTDMPHEKRIESHRDSHVSSDGKKEEPKVLQKDFKLSQPINKSDGNSEQKVYHKIYIRRLFL